MSKNKPLLRANSLGCIRGGFLLFTNISFKIFPGETLVVKGSNGSGKTSLLLSLMNLLPHNGEIHWSKDIKSFGFISHDETVKDYETVFDYLNFWSNFYSFQGSVNSLGKEFRLISYFDTLVGHLSLGQRKRLGICRLVMSKTKAWLLDEPQSSLDKYNKELLINNLDKHTKNGGITITTSHEEVIVSNAKLVDLNDR